MPKKVTVIGGGIIGAATAYYLTKKGAEVTLLEEKDIASGTSSSCDQAVLLQTKKPGPLLELAIESAELYANLEAELKESIEYKQGGGMILFENDEHEKMMSNLVAKQQKVGLDVNIISAKDAHKRQKGLSNHIIGSTWSKYDAKVNSLKTTFSFINAGKKLGAKIHTREKVLNLLVNNKQIIGVKTENNTFYSDNVVLATGIWSPELLEPFDLKLPVIPRRGHILVTEKVNSIVKCNLLSASYIAAKSGISGQVKTRAQELGVGLVMGQTHSGNILIGGSREFTGFNTGTNDEVVSEIAKATIKVFPEFKKMKIIRTFAGLRPYTPDGLPVMGPVPEISGLYLNTGHEGDGIAVAPISGKLLSEEILDDKVSMSLEPFSFSRF